ncbi:MAG TPA: DUF6174 domain-containing protein [Anaerolineales bacterium]|nr:DUF6174 domain-containing protein [Anaerolineales bacterium]
MTDPEPREPPKAAKSEKLAVAGLVSGAKPVLVWLVLIAAAAIVALILLYNALFPQTHWQNRELDRNLAKWTKQGITHYRMSVDVGGYGNFANMPLRVEVQNDDVVWAVDAQGRKVTTGDGLGVGPYFPSKLTITGLFSFSHELILRKPAMLLISYDPALGYPQSIYIDPWHEPCCQDYAIGVEDFKILSP